MVLVPREEGPDVELHARDNAGGARAGEAHDPAGDGGHRAGGNGLVCPDRGHRGPRASRGEFDYHHDVERLGYGDHVIDGCFEHGVGIDGFDHENDRRADHNDHHTSGDVGGVRTMTSTAPTLEARHVRAIGTTATVVVQSPDQADRAEILLADEIRRIDETCSRFRTDSEISWMQRHAGSPVRVSPLLFGALEIACEVARRTNGAVDPTVGNAIAALGYDRDYNAVVADPRPTPPALGQVAGYHHIHLDPSTRRVRVPEGVSIDLGATAKAWAADRAAVRIATSVGDGVLVSIGGDVAVAGTPPPGGWSVGIAVDSSTPGQLADQWVSITHGGLASSSTSVRRWRAGDRECHHIVDPASGDCAEPYWILTSAVGATCVDANALSTAAVVWGANAPERLAQFSQAMRLVRRDGTVLTLHGWPQ